MKFSRNFSPGQMDIDAMCPLKRGILQLAIAAPYATGKLILMHCVRSRSLLELSRHTPNSTEWQIKVFCREGGQRNIHVSSGQRNSQRNIHVSCGQRTIHFSSQPSRQKTLIFRCVPFLPKILVWRYSLHVLCFARVMLQILHLVLTSRLMFQCNHGLHFAFRNIVLSLRG